MRRVLIVDDNLLNRQVLENILSKDYSVIQAGGGEEALKLLRAESDQISAVILDLIMPDMDGYAVLTEMRSDARLKKIPVIVATASSEDSTELMALSMGANDFVTKPYKPAVIKCRLGNMISLRETAAIANAAERDALTGLYNREAFFQRAADMIASREAGYYVLSCLDVDNFKIINDQYGGEVGDEVLRHMADTFRSGFEAVGGIGCRINADHFAVLYPSALMDSRNVDALRQTASMAGGHIPPVTISIGRYVVSDLSLPVSAMYDRAMIAQASVKGRFDVHTALFSESMRAKIIREQEIVNDMYTALVDRQFEVWLQPQFNHATGALIGAEALARWRHPKKGLISPGEFIPVFERNGFIYELDRFVWEQCCASLRKWLDMGETPMPLSVNISRYDLFQDNFYDIITGLIRKYDLNIGLLRLEITESAFSTSPEHIIKEVRRLVEFGFTIEIDDFGSGYSSLNTLKDVPANVLKLDMRFLEGGDNTERGGNILESMVRMAKWLGMPVIAEGVETKPQADFLLSIGCFYVQGFLYAKPMPLSEYEGYISDADKESAMIAMETVDTLDNDAFWNPASMETLIFNSYVGGACIFEYFGGRTELLRVNAKYARELGQAGMSPEDVIREPIFNYMQLGDKAVMMESIRRAVETGEETTCEARVFYPDFSAPPIYINITVRLLARAGERALMYGTVFNVTAQRTAEQLVRETSEQLQAIMDNVNGGITATVIGEDKPHFLFANDQYFAQLGYTREQFEEEVDSAFNLIHPDDAERVMTQTRRASETQTPFTVIFRAIRRDKSVVWLQSNISITSLPNVEGVVQLAVANDITSQVTTRQREREAADQLKFLNDTAHDLLAVSDADSAVLGVLEKTMSYFGGCRVFVCEYDTDRRRGENTYEVCAPGAMSLKEDYRYLSFSAQWYWLETLEKSNLLVIQDTSKLGDDRAEERAFYRSLGIKSVIAVSLREGGKLIGLMGVHNPTLRLQELSNLGALGDYIAVMLQRRNMIAKIKADNQTLESLMNDSPGGFARLSRAPGEGLRAEYVNEGLRRMMNMTKEQAQAYYGSDALNSVHPDDMARVTEKMDEAILTGEPVTVKYRLMRSGGDYITVKVIGRATVDDSGVAHYNLYYTDMT